MTQKKVVRFENTKNFYVDHFFNRVFLDDSAILKRVRGKPKPVVNICPPVFRQSLHAEKYLAPTLVLRTISTLHQPYILRAIIAYRPYVCFKLLATHSGRTSLDTFH